MRTILYTFCLVTLSACAQGKEKKSNQSNTQELKQETMSENKDKATSNPENVIKSLIDAMKTNDAEKIRSLFNANASQAYGDGAAKSGAAFFKWLDSDIIDRKGHVENAKYSVDGNAVVVTGQYSSVGYTNKANFLFSVEDGKIMSWRMRY
jgi:ketosteroid isomerase-like protein